MASPRIDALPTNWPSAPHGRDEITLPSSAVGAPDLPASIFLIVALLVLSAFGAHIELEGRATPPATCSAAASCAGRA